MRKPHPSKLKTPPRPFRFDGVTLEQKAVLLATANKQPPKIIHAHIWEIVQR